MKLRTYGAIALLLCFCFTAVSEPVQAAPSGTNIHAESSVSREPRYGKLLPWDEASRLIPLKTKFIVIDASTGLSFNVQRRAGKNHADVQPLTKEDFRIMKQIYGGEWSWRRRAILVQTETELLAASMHGMPHGGDGIPDNGFKGHFCIHFLGSSTHGSGSLDPAHQLMVHKAAGKLREYVGRAAPGGLVDIFLIAASGKEAGILHMLFVRPDDPALDYFMNEEITLLRKLSAETVPDSPEQLTADIPVKVNVSRKGRRDEKTTYTFRLKRNSASEPWLIDAIDFKK